MNGVLREARRVPNRIRFAKEDYHQLRKLIIGLCCVGF